MEQSNFSGWAIVEVMGHQTHAGYVTTENYGAASLFRVDVPALPEFEETLRSDRYIDGEYVKAGSKYRVEAVDGYSKLIGAAAIYGISPCTEEAAKAAAFKMRRRPLIPVDIIRDEQPKMLEVIDSEEAEEAEEGDF